MNSPESSTRPGRQASGVIAVGLALLIVQVLGGFAGWWELEIDIDWVLLTAVSVYFTGLGALIIWKADSNRVGWVFGVIGVAIQLAGLTGALASRGLLVFEALGGGFWISWFLAIGVLMMWFPTGRVPSPGWMWLQWWGFGAVFASYVLNFFADSLCTEYDAVVGCVEFAPNPVGIPGVPNPEYGWVSAPLSAASVLFLIFSVISLAVRFRASSGVERQQIKWFLLACSVFAITFAVQLSLEAAGVSEPPVWLQVISMCVLAGIPLAATVAVLRYRLYDIDHIVSRTVSYALVVALLVGVVASVAAIVGTRFEDPLVVAATTLGVAAVFNPLRRHVQSIVDRRFNRSHYDAERVLDGFAGTLRDQVDPDGILEGWVEVVTETMHPATAGVWVRGS